MGQLMASTHVSASAASSEHSAEPGEQQAGSRELSPAERRVLTSPGMWGLLYLPALLALALLGYMAFHLYPGPGRLYGAGDRGSPNAQPGDK